MRVSVLPLVAACSIAGACPAVASVSLSVSGTFLKDNDALRQALGTDTLNPRFSTGLLLSFDASPLSPSYTMARRNFIQLNQAGFPEKAIPWWGYAINSYQLASASYSVAWDDGRADANDPTYPLWSIPLGNAMVIMFDGGVVPNLLRFDLDAAFQQTRNATFQGVSMLSTQPYPDEENVASWLKPSSMQNGTIGCSSQQGEETKTSSTIAGFRPETFTSTVNTRCSVSFDARAFIPVVPPPPTEQPLPAVPEPGTWAMMILGFGFAGQAVRRRRRQHAPQAAMA